MAHIPYTRQVALSHYATITSVLPANLELNNFSVFGGTLQERLDTAIHAISRYAGEVGIVVIHDTDGINARLSRLPAILNMPDLQFRADSGKIYDPLYGLSADAIVNLLAPMDPANPLSHSINSLRSGILAYLRIMECKFNQQSGPFGRYPYNLDLLVQLTQMPYVVLDRTVLHYMPANIADPIRTILNAPDMQQNVYACVTNLSLMMSEYLWQNRGFANHSGISIIDSVTNRQIISIRVPHSHPGILNYIDAELQMLEKQRIPFLLVNCCLDISKNEAIKKWFLDEHVGKGYYTAMIADSISSITENDQERGKIFSQYQQIIVFNCASASQAEPFSAQFGEYYRTEVEYTNGTAREPFKIFSSHHHDVAEKYVLERNIKVEDLIDLGNGILLCGSAYQLPNLIHYFNMNGGINNGTLLP